MSTKVVLHASNPEALDRARNNAINLRKDKPEAEIRIIANAQAVARALEQAKPECDSDTYLCPNSLKGLNLSSKAPFQVLASGAVTALVELQQQGWLYIHA